jgi:hypothetical protein
MDDTRAWIGERIPKERDLTLAELVELSTAIGQHREPWGHLVRHDKTQRVYAELYRDVHLDVWLCCWDSQQDTGFHDHDISSGAVYVCDGVLVEDRLVTGKNGIEKRTVDRAAGTHCYSPALWRMGYYSFDDDGNFCRSSVTYADEMWERPSGLVDALKA